MKIQYKSENGVFEASTKSSPCRLLSFDGNSLATRLIQSNPLSINGQITHDIKLSARTITAKFYIFGSMGNKWSKAELERNWSNIQKLLAVGKKGTLTFINDTGSYEIECFVTELQMLSRKVGMLYEFEVSFAADNPFWRKSEIISKRVGTVTGGMTYPYQYPLSYGVWSNSTAIINDTGYDIPLIIEFSNCSNNCMIINNTTGAFIKLVKNVLSTEKIIVTTEDMSVTKINTDGTISTATNDVDINSEPIYLVQGENILSMETDFAMSSNPMATIKYQELCIGVI